MHVSIPELFIPIVESSVDNIFPCTEILLRYPGSLPLTDQCKHPLLCWTCHKIFYRQNKATSTIRQDVVHRGDTKKLKLTPESLKAGVQTDQNIKLGRESNQRKTPLIDARLIHFYDAEKKRSFEFITNDFTSPPEQIAQYYKRRWQIELLFKRIKQRYPLRYFLGDSANAIKIQIWAALICDLLVQVIKNRVNTMRKNKWSYANIAALIKHHLMTYISLIEFLKNPEKAALQYQPPDGQLQLWGLSPWFLPFFNLQPVTFNVLVKESRFYRTTVIL